jgi:hypoxanthine phosphoribosyltransferase
MHKVYYTDENVKGWVHDIMRDLAKDNWKPSYVVGLTRGGLTPTLMISHYLDIPMETLKVSLRDDINGPESNLWMAEHAFNGEQILIVDDINDSGATLNWIKKDWQTSCLPKDPKWEGIWNHNVRFATLVNNEASEFKDVDYTGISINKIENPQWIVFPWENWWH